MNVLVSSSAPTEAPQLRDPTLLRDRALVAGMWVEADDPEARIVVRNPATGLAVGSVPRLGAVETRQAINAANAALPEWRAQTAKARSNALRRWFDLIVGNADDLAVILTSEQGKPLTEAKGEIAYAASFIEWFSEEARRVYGDTIPAHTPQHRILTLKQPIGVVAAITPWNFPAAMITRKAGAALAVGCTMVLKPASQTPLTALALAVLAERAGIPKGVLNVITGSAGEIGGELTSNPIVRKVSFTGSTEIGKKLMEQCARTVKRTSMELGGNAPLIVFDDANLDEAVAGAMASKFRNAGQTCVCANRIFVQDGIYNAFMERLAAAVSALKVGNGFANGVTIGPLIDAAAVSKVEEHISDAVSKGGKVVLGGRRVKNEGNFFEPTIISNASKKMRLFQEETFGPVAPIFRFTTEDEVIELANDTEVGLAGYFFAKDVGRVWRVAEKLECGMVGINTGLISTEVAPFGGIKESGNGREGSRYGLDDYIEIKYLCIGGI